MGNENEIKDLVQSKSAFLPEEIQDLSAARHVYSLDDEFSKTKKNRSLLFPFIVLAFMSVLVLAAVGITKYTEWKQQKAVLSITEFDDLKLGELLSGAKKFQGQLKNAQTELESLRKKMDEEMSAAGSPSERNKIRSKYQGRIGSKEREIASLEKEMQSYDFKLEQTVKKAEEMVNNYKRLHELKMNEQRDQIILKYNPKYDNARLNAVIHASTSPAVKRGDPSKLYQQLAAKKLITAAGAEKLKRGVDNQLLIMDRLLQIPYVNSVRPSLAQMHHLMKSSANDYETLVTALFSLTQRQEAAIRGYQYALEQYGRQNRESGFIVDARDSDSIRVYVSKVLKVRSGDRAMVFREDDQYIGTIEFYMAGGEIRAKRVELAGINTFHPFDKILIKQQGE
ncbi:MAG TPA: hypothetical protein PKJ16_08320 [Spirochaetota bacterium]|nr:hypothetical protein [Spirochaetota bacterium]HPU90330.1 hypothetical protein [Spirochaetota bacterium]